MKQLYAFLQAKYDRYLRDVNWRQCRLTMGAFYGFVAGVLHILAVSPRLTLEASAALTFAALLIYLIIPKPARALLDNLAAKAASDPELASRIAAVAQQIAERAPAGKGRSTDGSSPAA